MKNKSILLFSAIVALTTNITMINATEPAINPKQPEIENCNFLNDLVNDTTKRAKKEKDSQKKQALDKNISNWEKQLETGHCKKVTKELSCKELQDLINATKKMHETAKFTAAEWQQETEKLKDLNEHLKNCK